MVWEQATEDQCDSVSEGLISMESNNILYLTKEYIRDECATNDWTC